MERRLLIVDQDPLLRAALEELFGDLGYVVASAAGGEEALEQLGAGFTPALIFADVGMPALNGDALCRTLKASLTYSSVPVYLLSARAMNAATWGECGAAGYLLKPVKVEEIREIARRVLGSPGVE